ncbi:hypothetical protein EDC96DRAFT_517560 [Choanephora cucurbitarum]|nr:hypothetical protein EDC96DRAFT_517560 [Choanephora cucurbitarum]
MSSKADVRKLFKKQQKERSKTNRISHVFAKYDETGRLLCVVCNSPVKSETIWQAHLSSSGHKENLQKLRALKQQQQQQQLKRPASPLRQQEQDTQIHKRARIAEQDERQGIELDEDESEDETMPLPDDFFDQNQEEENQEEEEEEENGNNALPRGFFDDPEQEARVQGTLAPEEQAQAELEKDLQLFNEAMIDVTKESREVQEEDDETFWRERNYDIFQEQAVFDSRVEKLKALRKTGETKMQLDSDETDEDSLRVHLKSSVRQVLTTKPVKQVASMFDDDDDDESEEEDWRAQQL